MANRRHETGGNDMKTVEEIVAAVEKLNPDQFVRFRQKLHRLEEKMWKAELKRTTAEMKRKGITDSDIDRMVMRRRRENRR
jgi:DNA-binding transcriptional regulator YhcF (GntR family)